jgi:hypothetical protein
VGCGELDQKQRADNHLRAQRAQMEDPLYLAIACHRLPSLARSASRPRRSRANPRQIAIRQRPGDQAKRPGSFSRADSLPSLCRPFGWLHVRHVRQVDRGQDAGTAAVVPVVCRSDAGQRQADGPRPRLGLTPAGVPDRSLQRTGERQGRPPAHRGSGGPATRRSRGSRHTGRHTRARYRASKRSLA